MSAMPQAFQFQMPEVAPMPGMPNLEWDGGNFLAGGPRLGIDAEDISGQLGSYFGAPDGEGILVRDAQRHFGGGKGRREGGRRDYFVERRTDSRRRGIAFEIGRGG